MSKEKQRLWLLWIMVIYFVIAIGGFFIVYCIETVLHAAQHHKQPLKTAVITPLPTPIGWKVYENKNYHLQLSYPPNETVQTSTYGVGITSVEIKKANVPDFQILLLPKSLAQAAGQDFDTFYALPDKTPKIIRSPLTKDTTIERFTKLRNRTIKGMRALDYRAFASDNKAGDEAEIGTIIESGDNLMLISTKESKKTQLEQMLTTVRIKQ